MTELELHKFITDNNIEWRWEYDDNNERDVIIFVDFDSLESFSNLFMYTSIYDDGAIDCVMRNDYICFWMGYICRYFDVNMKNVFPHEN